MRAAIVVGFAHLFVKFFGLIQSKFLAYYFGTTALTDAYLFAFDGILMTLFLIGEELIGPAFLPVFKEALDQDDEDKAWDTASAILQMMLLILSLSIAARAVGGQPDVYHFERLQEVFLGRLRRREPEDRHHLFGGAGRHVGDIKH